ncbi:MAG: Hpt domain-containing protein, partial [Leptolyngbyaceae cyanobacterium MO_188.B28]|nr:Hpt domain-containing protein [Leptolyngbyaceae cyanobacterium MO_188.B28]
MSQDKESEIRLQFLDEAQEYLGTLESAMLGIASGIDIDKINASLRAAHSIKGGAAMMGFQTLSEFAHRLEDSFKVLKVQKNSVEVDPDLEQLLLTGVDCLQQVLTFERQAAGIDPNWLETQANPIFERLYERLGEPQAEDAHSMLSPEDGHDIIPLLFQTEVEGCLQRLESVLDEAAPCLKEEVDILAQELGGLGEMLQLNAFTQLCMSVAQHLAAAPPDQVEAVARAALEVWRRTQALVLTGNLTTLPTAIEVPGLTAIADAPMSPPSEDVFPDLVELADPPELAPFDIIVSDDITV